MPAFSSPPDTGVCMHIAFGTGAGVQPLIKPQVIPTCQLNQSVPVLKVMDGHMTESSELQDAKQQHTGFQHDKPAANAMIDRRAQL